MELEHDVSDVEKLMREWNSLRVTEAYRRVHFTLLRDEALARWDEGGPYDETSTNYVRHRVARGNSALGEIVELEDQSDASYAQCCSQMTDLPQLSAKVRNKSLARVRGIASRAVREELRYRTTLLSTLHREANELTVFIDEKLGPLR